MSLAQQPILFPDVELLTTGLLRTVLAGRPESYAANVLVSNKVPTTRRDRMVIVRRDGGRASGVLDDARVGIRVWGRTEQEAADLARLVLALCWALPAEDDAHELVRFTHESGPTPVPDESGQPLRYIVGTFRTRGSAL